MAQTAADIKGVSEAIGIAEDREQAQLNTAQYETLKNSVAERFRELEVVGDAGKAFAIALKASKAGQALLETQMMQAGITSGSLHPSRKIR